MSIAGCFSNMVTFPVSQSAKEECGGQAHGSVGTGEGPGETPEDADTSTVCQPLQS